MVRALVHDYLSKRLSRREFITRMATSGFSLAAAASILDSLTPLFDAEVACAASEGGHAAMTIVEGTGGDLLVEQLRAASVRFLFNCNSSGTYAVFDALVDRPDVQVIEVPQEGQMISVAHGYTLASGKIAFTLNDSSGFPNTLTNMFNAWKDRTPIVIGCEREVSRFQGGRDAYEEWDDLLSPSSSFTRWRWSVETADRIPEITRRAFTIASTPPEGPVALAFPENVLAAKGVRAAVIDRDKFIIAPKVTPNPGLVEQAGRLLLEARSPVLLVGPEVTRSEAVPAVIALAERLSMPVMQGECLFADFPTNHPLFLGDYALEPRYPKDVDLVLNLGAKMPFEYGVIPSDARVIHVSINADIIGRLVPTDVGMVADVKEAATDLLTALESLATKTRLEEIGNSRLVAIRAHTEMIRAGQARAARALWNNSPLSWERMAGELDQLLEKDAIIVSELTHQRWDAGWTWAASEASELLEKGGIAAPQLAFAQNTALSQFTFAPGGKTKIGKTTGGALGWGVGAAIGVKLAQPDRQVVALQGDGSFMFGQAEALWTMARYEVPVIVVIFNNRSYNSPRNHIMNESERQRRTGKDMTCYLGDPDVDFARVAAGFGVKGEVITTPDQVAPAIQRAIASTREGRPYLIDAVVGRTGAAADSTWYPKYSVAAGRANKV
jgi:thiamine pyrophosphate-dependent acetolactate synthase large subunit-like protein